MIETNKRGRRLILHLLSCLEHRAQGPKVNCNGCLAAQ